MRLRDTEDDVCSLQSVIAACNTFVMISDGLFLSLFFQILRMA